MSASNGSPTQSPFTKAKGVTVAWQQVWSSESIPAQMPARSKARLPPQQVDPTHVKVLASDGSCTESSKLLHFVNVVTEVELGRLRRRDDARHRGASRFRRNLGSGNRRPRPVVRYFRPRRHRPNTISAHFRFLTTKSTTSTMRSTKGAPSSCIPTRVRRTKDHGGVQGGGLQNVRSY